MEQKEVSPCFRELLAKIVKDLERTRDLVADFSDMHQVASSHGLHELVSENAALRLRWQACQGSTDSADTLTPQTPRTPMVMPETPRTPTPVSAPRSVRLQSEPQLQPAGRIDDPSAEDSCGRDPRCSTEVVDIAEARAEPGELPDTKMVADIAEAPVEPEEWLDTRTATVQFDTDVRLSQGETGDSAMQGMLERVRPSTKKIMPEIGFQGLSHGFSTRSLDGFTFVSETRGFRRRVEYIRFFAQAVVQHCLFELGFALLLIANAITMAVDVQYNGIEAGYQLMYHSSTHNAADIWPNCQEVVDMFDWFFGIAFVLEVCLKLFALGLKYFSKIWNYIDLLVVVLFLGERITENFSFVSPETLKMMRLARLARMARLVRTLEGFDALFVMSTALKGSLSILVWAFLLLFLVQFICAVLISQLLFSIYFDDISQPLTQRRQVYEYFGTFTRAVFSMFELTMANWPPVARLLSEYVSEWFMLFCVMHKLVIGFAVIGVINGVFIQETFKVVSADDNIMVRRKRQANAKHQTKMRALFDLMDENNDGQISLAEFRAVAGVPHVKTWLSSMELETDDLPALFYFIDSDFSGGISAEELVSGVARLRGAARSIDVMRVLRTAQKIDDDGRSATIQGDSQASARGCDSSAELPFTHALSNDDCSASDKLDAILRHSKSLGEL